MKKNQKKNKNLLKKINKKDDKIKGDENEK
jgi:hypothetical protein